MSKSTSAVSRRTFRHGQFLLYSSGTCSTQAEDPRLDLAHTQTQTASIKHSPRPLTVLRALSVVALGEDGGNEAEPFLCSMVDPSHRSAVLPP